jgi:circadian clock protein KaiC
MASAIDKLKNIKNQRAASIKTIQRSENIQPIRNAGNFNVLQKVNQIEDSDEIIKRPPIEAGRVATGIIGFDSMIQGGFKRNSINLLSGGPGTGKTIFGVQYLINGAKLFNEVGLYISFDESKENVFSDTKNLGLDLEGFTQQGKFYFVEYSPSQMLEMLNEGGGTLDNLMNKAKPKRVVIDSISTFLLMSNGEFARKELLTSLFKLLWKWDVTALLIDEYSYTTGNEFDKKVLSLDFEVDSITILYYLQNILENERKRLIEIYKMRGSRHITRAVRYEIGYNGIRVY